MTLPDFVAPQLATLVERPPDEDGWIHEIKFDGYRLLARVGDGPPRLFTRHAKDWTAKFGATADALARLKLGAAWLDGEVVAPDGTFEGLQQALSEGRHRDLVYFVFDAPFLDGRDRRALPLEDRKALLEKRRPHDGPVRVSEHLLGRGAEVYRQACKLQLEGIVSKRRDAPYRSGRGLAWVKTKCRQAEEFVIVGWTDPEGSRAGFGSLMLGVQGSDGLTYAGRVGTGFDDALLRSLRRELEALARPSPPVRNAPRGRGLHWVEPERVAQVGYSNWTRDRMLRHPVFLGLREDKTARETVRERPLPPPDRLERGSAIAGVRLTNPQRLLFPAAGVTKRELAEYYEAVVDRMLPHVEGRLLSLVRCPRGAGGPCFYQKDPGETMPEAFQRAAIVEGGEPTTRCWIRDLAGLVASAQMDVLELHPWGSRVEALERPDRCIFDLDPSPDVPWRRVVELARRLRSVLEADGRTPFLKTTGGKGLHVVVSVSGLSWPELKAWSKAVADALVRDDPSRLTAKLQKSARTGKIFIDYLRNARGATAVAPYSPRARPSAPVAVPIAWDELTPRLKPDGWTVRSVLKRLKRLSADPWLLLN